MVLLSACGRQPFDATPDGVLREFLDRADRFQGDPKDARAVFDLLSRSAQTNLSDRARRASAATGKRMGPEQMIATAYFYPHFQPREWNTKVAGDRAIVEIVGASAEGEHATVPCVLEDGRWRVDVALPALPPIERRPTPPKLSFSAHKKALERPAFREPLERPATATVVVTAPASS